MKKISNIEAALKKSVPCKKRSVYQYQNKDQVENAEGTGRQNTSFP